MSDVILKYIVTFSAYYAFLWLIIGGGMFVHISYGSTKYIKFMDQQLAKDINKCHDHMGNLTARYSGFTAIGSRCVDYWFMFPFIQHRVTTNSMKFKVFMWFNSLGLWNVIILAFCALLFS